MGTAHAAQDTTSEHALAERVAALEGELAKTRKERDFLRAAYDALKRELELLKRRIFIATAERVDSEQLKLEFEEKLALLNRLADTLDEAPGSTSASSRPSGSSAALSSTTKEPPPNR